MGGGGVGAVIPQLQIARIKPQYCQLLVRAKQKKNVKVSASCRPEMVNKINRV